MTEQKPRYAIYSIIVATCFWFFDSVVHYFFYGESEFEWIPSEFNELWMRSTIIFLILSLGAYAQHSTRKMIEAEHAKLLLQEQLNQALQNELDLQHAQAEVTRETVMQMHDIINNFLNNLLLFKMEAEDSKSISTESLKLFDHIVQEASTKIRDLGENAMEKSPKPVKKS